MTKINSINIKFSLLPVDGLNDVIWGLTHWHEFEAVAVIHNNSLVGLGFISSTHRPKNILAHFAYYLKLKNFSHDDQQIYKFMTSWPVHEISTTAYGTTFQQQVWQNLLTIPHNKTLSYKDIAIKINKPEAFRAVGQAVGRNPVAGIIPCHRVIPASGKTGGFRWGVDVKQQLLQKESDQL